MSKKNIETMRKLVEQLVGADVAYYKHDSPIMTDREYDTMYDKLLRTCAIIT